MTSEAVCSLAWPDEVFYRRLMSIVDDFGRHEANPQLLRSKCYPLQTDVVRVADISRSMAACQKAGLVVLYEVHGKQYLEVSKFGQQQRTASKCPAFDEQSTAIDFTRNHLLANAHLGVVVVEDEGDSSGDGGAVDDSPATPARLPVILIPINGSGEVGIFADQLHEFEALYPAVDVMAELRKMRGWAVANPTRRKTKTGVLRFVNAWLSKAQDTGGIGQRGAAPVERGPSHGLPEIR